MGGVAFHHTVGAASGVGAGEQAVYTCCVHAASLAQAPFHLAKLPRCCCLIPKQLICLLHKTLWLEMLKPSILLGSGPLLAEGGGCQMDTAYCDFKKAFGGEMDTIC